MDKKDINNSSYAYSVSLLKMLLAMQLITEDEYERITQISAEHYGADLLCVGNLNSQIFGKNRWKY